MKPTSSILLSALLSLPLLAQEPAPAPAPQADTAAQAKQLDEIKIVDQKQNMVLEGLSEQINSQRLLLQESNNSIQEQTVLYEQCLKRMTSLSEELKAALLANAQLNEKMGNFDQSLTQSDQEANRKSEKLDAFILEFGRQTQRIQAQDKNTAALQALVNSNWEAGKLELSQIKATLEQLEMNLNIQLAELQELKFAQAAQASTSKEQNTRLALELAQSKLELADYKKSQELQQDKLIANMAAGMILLFFCIVTIAFIQFINNKRLKSGVLTGVSAKLQEAATELRQMSKQNTKAEKPAPKPRRQR
ncbi:MAG: hypothetical protein R3Y56_02520 [Akkermansia sp.]